MDEETKLLLALYQVEGIIALTKDNEYKEYIFRHMNPVFWEIKRQLTNLQQQPILKEQSKEKMNQLYVVDQFVPFPQYHQYLST